jgi:hypothetical protein
MLITCVVYHQVQDHCHAISATRFNEPLHVFKCPIARIHGLLVGDVVPIIFLRRSVDGLESEHVSTEREQVRQF